jgi:hypothetical protein
MRRRGCAEWGRGFTVSGDEDSRRGCVCVRHCREIDLRLRDGIGQMGASQLCREN